MRPSKWPILKCPFLAGFHCPLTTERPQFRLNVPKGVVVVPGSSPKFRTIFMIMMRQFYGLPSISSFSSNPYSAFFPLNQKTAKTNRLAAKTMRHQIKAAAYLAGQLVAVCYHSTGDLGGRFTTKSSMSFRLSVLIFLSISLLSFTASCGVDAFNLASYSCSIRFAASRTLRSVSEPGVTINVFMAFCETHRGPLLWTRLQRSQQNSHQSTRRIRHRGQCST